MIKSSKKKQDQIIKDNGIYNDSREPEIKPANISFKKWMKLQRKQQQDKEEEDCLNKKKHHHEVEEGLKNANKKLLEIYNVAQVKPEI